MTPSILFSSRRFVIFSVLFFCGVHLSFAQEKDPLVTDRPGFSASPITVPKGDLQIESGLSWERSSDADLFKVPEALLRWAMTDGLEVRLSIPDYVDAENTSGFGDAGVGIKAYLGDIAGWDVAAVVSISLPTGQSDLSSDSVDPELILTTGGNVGEILSAGAQIAVCRDDEDVSVSSAIAVGASLAENIGTFLEIGAFGLDEESAAFILHHGYTFSVGDLMQLDVHGGIGLSDKAPDVFFGIGWCTRL